ARRTWVFTYAMYGCEHRRETGAKGARKGARKELGFKICAEMERQIGISIFRHARARTPIHL
ncbi:hypothetical protein LTR87_018131, partial [Friedmanniomyces endolithicus]